jgi:hypothetical protein
MALKGHQRIVFVENLDPIPAREISGANIRC